MLTKVSLVKVMVFPVVMYGCESWIIKKAEHWRIDAFELWRSHQSILKEISPEYSLEGLMVKLKFQYYGHLMGRSDLLEKTLMLGKIEGRRRRDQQRVRWLDGITDLMDMVARSWTRLSNWTDGTEPSVPDYRLSGDLQSMLLLCFSSQTPISSFTDTAGTDTLGS